MKKRFIPVMLASLMAFGAVGCKDKKEDDNNPGEQEPAATYSVSITNKQDIIDGEWSVGNTGPTLTIATNPKANVRELVNNGTIQITSSNTAVATISGLGVVLVSEGKTTITVKCGESEDSVELNVLAYIDPIKNKPTMATTPVVGKTYKLGIEQYGLATPSMIYLAGKKLVNYYWQSTNEFLSSVDVTVLEAAAPNGEFKYNLKVTELENGAPTTWYIGAAVSGTHVNDTVETSPTTLWKWDSEHNTFLTHLNSSDKGDADYYLGTYGTYNTFSLSNISKIGESYPSHIYEIPAVMNVANKEVTLIQDLHETEKINVVNPQGDVTFTVEEGKEAVVTVDAEGNLTAGENGTAKVTVSDGSTSIDVAVTVRDAVKGETAENPFTAAEFKTEALKLNKDGEISKDSFYVKAEVASIQSKDKVFFDSKNYIYKLLDSTGKQFESVEAMPFASGDEILVYGQFENYNNTAEMVNAKLIDYTNKKVAVTVAENEQATVAFTEGVEEGMATNLSTVKFTVSPEAGYEIVSVKVNNLVVAATDDVYSFVVRGKTEIVVTTKEEGSVIVPKGATYSIDGSKTGVNALVKNSDGDPIVTSLALTQNAYIKTNGGKDATAWSLDNCLKIGKSSAGGTITLGLDTTYAFSQIKITGYGWSDTASLKVNSEEAQVFGVVANKENVADPSKAVTLTFNVASGESSLTLSNSYSSGNHSVVIIGIEFVAPAE